jgi:hypothetical protein
MMMMVLMMMMVTMMVMEMKISGREEPSLTFTGRKLHLL